MERIIQVFDPKTQSVRNFQGIELSPTKSHLSRWNGCFVDGGNLGLIILLDEKAVIQGYEDGGTVVPAEGDKTPPKVKHTRKTRSDKGKKRGPIKWGSRKKASFGCDLDV